MTDPSTPTPLPNGRAMDLSAVELSAFARRVLANHVYEDTEWLQWEAYPMLSEQAFMDLQDAVDVLTREAISDADAHDRAENIDSMLLIEQARDA